MVVSYEFLLIIIALFVDLSFSQLSLSNEVLKCSKGQFECKDGRCIDHFALCDGFTDCIDASDETVLECANMRCPHSISFQCAYGGCIGAENKCDGKPDCLDSSDEDLQLCFYAKCPKNLFQCKNNKCIHPDGLCNNKEDCGDGSDENFENCGLNKLGGSCLKPEKPKNGKYLILKDKDCTTPEYLDIDQRSANLSDICLEFICDDGYVLDEFRGRYISKCVDGVWIPSVPSCLGCGINLNARAKPLIYEPNVKSESHEPWHVGLYLYNSTDYNYKCGGTVVHSRAIISAAHCFKEIPDWYNPFHIVDKFAWTDLRLTLGKQWRNYNLPEKYLQILQIEDVRINGYSRNYENDIAIIIVKEKINITISIMPVCMDISTRVHQSYNFKPSSEIKGKVVGFGDTDEKNWDGTGSSLSVSLQAASFRVCCTLEQCLNNTETSCRGDVDNITRDKFCVNILSNGTRLGPGDSGGGFIVERNRRQYLYGVVSLETSCRDRQLYTLVNYHAKWLLKNLVPY